MKYSIVLFVLAPEKTSKEFSDSMISLRDNYKTSITGIIDGCYIVDIDLECKSMQIAVKMTFQIFNSFDNLDIKEVKIEEHQ